MFRKLFNHLRPPEDLPVHRLSDRDRREHRAQTIPCTLYQLWEDDLFGAEHLASIERFRDCNPDLDFRLFTAPDLAAYMHETWHGHPILQVFDRTRFGPMRADIFRYCILHERGGYYCDISKGVDTRITSLHPPEARALISAGGNDELLYPPPEAAKLLKMPHKRLIQWCVGFAPEHPILARMLDRICEAAPDFEGRTFENPKHAILMLTGPGMFNQVVREHLGEKGADGIAQCGVDLDGHGIFELPGSHSRYKVVPHYTHARDQPILDAPQ